MQNTPGEFLTPSLKVAPRPVWLNLAPGPTTWGGGDNPFNSNQFTGVDLIRTFREESETISQGNVPPNGNHNHPMTLLQSARMIPTTCIGDVVCLNPPLAYGVLRIRHIRIRCDF